jgi:hypothetical protein
MLESLTTGQYFGLPIFVTGLASIAVAHQWDRIKRSLVKARERKIRDDLNAN